MATMEAIEEGDSSTEVKDEIMGAEATSSALIVTRPIIQLIHASLSMGFLRVISPKATTEQLIWQLLWNLIHPSNLFKIIQN